MAEYNAKNAPGSAEMSSAFGETHNYFVKNVLPHSIQAHIRTVRTPTAYARSGDQTFLLVRAGRGSITVNGLDYRLKPDTLVGLGPFHICRFTPDEGETLELVESRINSGTYMYLIANPYFRIPRFIVPSEPPVVYLRGIERTIARQAMDGLLAESGGQAWDRDSLCICHVTALFGIVSDETARANRRKKK